MLTRNEEIVSQYRAGDTLAEVGTSFGLTRERVRQIVAAQTSERHWGSRRREAKDVEIRAAFAAVKAGADPDVFAQALGIERISLIGAFNRRGLYLREPAQHGEFRMYRQGCKCAECRRANAIHQRRLQGRTPLNHGASGYANYGCRCEECRAGAREAGRRARRKARAT